MKVNPDGQTLSALNGPLKWANQPFKGGGVIDIPTPSAPSDDDPSAPWENRQTFWFGAGVKVSTWSMGAVPAEGADNIVAYLAGMDPGNQFFTYISVDRQGWGAGWSGSAVAVFMTGLRDPRDLKGVELGGWDFTFTVGGKWAGAAKSLKNASWFKRMLDAARSRHALGAAELSEAISAIKLQTAAFGIDMDTPKLDLKVLDIPFAGYGLEVGVYHGISRLWPFAIDLADEKVSTA